MEKKGTKILVVSEKEKVRSKDKRKTRLNSNGRPVSKRGKIRVQNWKSDPMNSPKAFGELKITYHKRKICPHIKFAKN